MTPIERWCLYGIATLTGILGITRAVEAWITYLENRYWTRH